MIRPNIKAGASQNREPLVLVLTIAGICGALLAGCANDNTAPSTDADPDCMRLVRTAMEGVDRTSAPEEGEDLIEAALRGLGAAPPPHCERDLLLELLDLQEAVSDKSKLILTGERLLKLEHALSPDQRARVKRKLAEAYFAIGSPRSFDLAKDVFLQWDSLNERSMKMFQVTSLLVKTYDLTGELEECSKLLQGALEKARKQGDPLWTGELLDRLGELYVRQGKSADALPLQREGLDLLDAYRQKGVVRDTLLHRKEAQSSATKSNGASDNGASVRHESTPRLLTIRDQLLLRHRLRYHMGEAFESMGKGDSAKTAFLDALAIAMGPLGGSVEAPYVELGELLLGEGSSAQAISYGTEGLNHARKTRDSEAVRRAAELLYHAYKESGDVRNALTMHELAEVYEDSIGDASFSIGLVKNQVLYEVRDDSLRMASELGREQLERANAQLEARSNRTIAVAVGGLGLLLLAGAGFWFRSDRKRRQDRHEREAAQLETQALRSQMNPHFIFNALNSINDYVQQNDQDSASSYLIKFARVMRAVLENSRQSEVALCEDLDALRGYLELERMRMHQKFDFTMEVAPDINPDQVMVPPLVVQPFVENAIWHGISGKEGHGHISLKVERRGTQLVWVIEDDGVGRNASKAPDASASASKTGQVGKKTSLGTAITRSRLDLVEKQHGGKAGFRYIDLEQGTRVEVDMPLIQD